MAPAIERLASRLKFFPSLAELLEEIRAGRRERLAREQTTLVLAERNGQDPVEAQVVLEKIGQAWRERHPEEPKFSFPQSIEEAEARLDAVPADVTGRLDIVTSAPGYEPVYRNTSVLCVPCGRPMVTDGERYRWCEHDGYLERLESAGVRRGTRRGKGER